MCNRGGYGNAGVGVWLLAGNGVKAGGQSGRGQAKLRPLLRGWSGRLRPLLRGWSLLLPVEADSLDLVQHRLRQGVRLRGRLERLALVREQVELLLNGNNGVTVTYYQFLVNY